MTHLFPTYSSSLVTPSGHLRLVPDLTIDPIHGWHRAPPTTQMRTSAILDIPHTYHRPRSRSIVSCLSLPQLPSPLLSCIPLFFSRWSEQLALCHSSCTHLFCETSFVLSYPFYSFAIIPSPVRGLGKTTGGPTSRAEREERERDCNWTGLPYPFTWSLRTASRLSSPPPPLTADYSLSVLLRLVRRL